MSLDLLTFALVCAPAHERALSFGLGLLYTVLRNFRLEGLFGFEDVPGLLA